MLSFRWSFVVPILCNVGVLTLNTTASAFQYPPLSDDLNTRQIHGADSWIEGEHRTPGNINESPADFGPASGLWQRTADGNPASGDSFQTMQAGPLPGGFSPHGFNSSGMIPPVNQPDYIANNPVFGGRGNNGQLQNGNNPYYAQHFSAQQNGQPNNQFPNGQFSGPFQANGGQGGNQRRPNGAFDPNNRPRPRVQQGMSSASAKQPYVGLLGQVTRPGVYEITPGRDTLSDLIERIGGLAKDASGQLRVIRNGRPGQSTSYAAASYFELLPGDLVISDAQVTRNSSSGTTRSGDSASAQSGVATRQSAPSHVQIGFINLLDRPVVLKLRAENANIPNILAMMRQDQGLASEIKIVPPAGQGQRFQNPNQLRFDSSLPSETVLIFPQNAVAAERLEHLPEPTMLKANQDNNEANPSPQQTPPAKISPDISSQFSMPSASETDSAVTYIPPPPTFGEENAQPSNSAPLRIGGVRSSTRDQISRDSDMVLAPPAEGVPSPIDRHQSGASNQQSVGAFPTREVPASNFIHENDSATAPRANDTWNEDTNQSAEPSRLRASREHRAITDVTGKGAVGDDGFAEIAPNLDANIDEANNAKATIAAAWSIWPPILTAGVGLIALLGFSWSLRRRTQADWQSPKMPRREYDHSRVAASEVESVQPQTASFANKAASIPTDRFSVREKSGQSRGSVENSHNHQSDALAPQHEFVTTSENAQAPVESQFRSRQPSTAVDKQLLLDSLINNQLPMVEEKVKFASPLQFHGRPAAPKNLRLDQGHAMPKPHTSNVVSQSIAQQAEPSNEFVTATSSSGPSLKFRVDQSAPPTSKPATRFVPAKRVEATTSKMTSHNNSGVSESVASSTKRPVVASGTIRGPLDRALSAVQTREERP